MNYKKIIFAIIAAILIIYSLGPKPNAPVFDDTFPKISFPIEFIDDSIRHHESAEHIIAGCEAQIIFQDTTKRRTSFVLLYLPGFSANHPEGAPTHLNIAHTFGMNAYLARNFDHGIQTDSALNRFTADGFWEKAKHDLAVADQLGDQVIIMSTSTGGSAALKLAAEFPEKVKGLILYSPNIRLKDPKSNLLIGPWGQQIAEKILGVERNIESQAPGHSEFWYLTYQTKSLVELQNFLIYGLNEKTFHRVKCPIYVAAYDDLKGNEDPVVSVSAMEWMYNHVQSTSKSFQKFDSGNHIIANPHFSTCTSELEKSTADWLQGTFNIVPVANEDSRP